MDSLKEIHSIVSSLNLKEKKAAKQYFSRYNINTKELQLFNLIEKLGQYNKSEIELAIKNIGYESSEVKSFQKLRIRLKIKLFDFLLAKSTTEPKGKIDENSFLIQRLKKSNLQAGILIEKSFLNQSDDLLRNTIKLAKENDQYGEMIEALSEIRRIHEIKANYIKKKRVDTKIKHYRVLSDQLDQLEASFVGLVSRFDTDLLDHVELKMIDLIHQIRSAKKQFSSHRLDFMEDFIRISLLQYEGQNDKSLLICMKWIRFTKNYPMKLNASFKHFLFRVFIENLFICNKMKHGKHYLNAELEKSKAKHHEIEFILLDFHYSLINLDIDRSREIYNAIDKRFIHGGKMKQMFSYYRIFHEFNNMDFKEAMYLINDNMRSYSSASFQQVDLMILELMCMYEMEKLDVLEYKIQSFAKNIAYRKKYNLPEYYLIISKLFNNLLRTNFIFTDGRVMYYFNEIQNMEIDGLSKYRSLQPNFFKLWFAVKSNVKQINEINDLIPMANAS